jgi:HAD superfamily hydrolase (TIGR01509 family)
MIKGIIFDMDGVLIDSNSICYDVWNEVFERRFNITLDKKEFASHLGESSKHFTEFFLKRYNLNYRYEDLNAELNNNFIKNRKRIKLKKGIREALQKFKKKYKIALATGADKEDALYTVTTFGISDYFDYIIAGNEVKIAKPNPEIFIKAAEVLKLKPEECVVIEDANLGITAAKRAGMKVIVIPDALTKFQNHSMADIHLKSISELNDKILKKLGG